MQQVAKKQTEEQPVSVEELRAARQFVNLPWQSGDSARACGEVHQELAAVQAGWKNLPPCAKYLRLCADLKTAKTDLEKAQQEVFSAKCAVDSAIEAGQNVADAERSVRETKVRVEELEYRVETTKALIDRARLAAKAALHQALKTRCLELRREYEAAGNGFLREVALFLRRYDLDGVAHTLEMISATHFDRSQSTWQHFIAPLFELPE